MKGTADEGGKLSAERLQKREDALDLLAERLQKREAALDLRGHEVNKKAAAAEKETRVQKKGRQRLDDWQEELAADENRLEQDQRKLLRRSGKLQKQEDENNTLVEAWRDQLKEVEEFMDETVDPADNLLKISESLVDLRQEAKLFATQSERLVHAAQKAERGQKRSDEKKHELRGEVRELQKTNTKLEEKNKDLRKYKKNSKAREERLNEKISHEKAKMAGVAEGLAQKYEKALQALEEEEERESTTPAPTTKSRGRFTNELRWLVYDCLSKSVAMHSLPEVLKLVFAFCKVGHLQVPAPTTIRRFSLEMHLLADAQLGYEVSKSSSLLVGWDGSMRDRMNYVSTSFTTNSKTLYGGVTIANGKQAQDVVDAVIRKEGQIKVITEAVFGPKVAAGFGLERCAAGGGGRAS